jgi:hypothetical protein
VLHQELQEKATDPILLKRRFRMLAQLAQFESQIYKKIYNFTSDELDDFVLAIEAILLEIKNVADRSG